MRFARLSTWLTATLSLLSSSEAITLDVTSKDSIEKAASIAAAQMLTFYNGTKPGYAPGVLTNPYYWWEAGAMFGTLIHFYHLTGNDSLNKLVMDGMLWQRGENNNFEPSNYTSSLGNDDQGFWAYAAMDAAEFGFPNPSSQYPSWLSLAQAVFNRQIQRWDSKTCNGGLRWQIYQFNPGWNYKNTAANGGLFHIAARLARYTGNSTYADQADRLWNWMTALDVPFVYDSYDNSTNTTRTAVIDGGDTLSNCTQNIDNIQWTYNHGTVLMGAAYMYNYTNGSDIWSKRLQNLVSGADIFFVKQQNNITVDDYISPAPGGKILSEVACETLGVQTCKIDQPAFKSTLVRWLAVVTQLAPQYANHIYPLLNASAQAAAQQCIGSYGTVSIENPQSGGNKGSWCGRRWYQNTFDGLSGLGEQMSAMSAFQNVLIGSSSPPYTTVSHEARPGGASESDPNAGNTATTETIFDFVYTSPVTRADTAGAWVLTAFAMILMAVGFVWVVREDSADAWAGNDEKAGWQAPSAGPANMYKKTYGYGAYRLAGLQAGGVYKGKSSTARRAFAKPNMPAIGLGQGSWWFGTGRGTTEKWYEKDRARHEHEVAQTRNPYGQFGRSESGLGHAPRDSVASESSTTGLFSKLKSKTAGAAASNKKSKAPKPPKPEPVDPKVAAGWIKVGKNAYVKQREVPAGGDSDAGSVVGGGTRSPMPPRGESAQNVHLRDSRASGVRSPASMRSSGVRSPVGVRSPPESARGSRAASVTRDARGRTLHWPINEDE